MDAMPQQSSGFDFRHVVLQPTSGCNINCKYCYLTERRHARLMTTEVAVSVAKALEQCPHPVTILWHGGEPLSIGLPRLRALCAPFQELKREGRIQHGLQTNATLLTDEWCDFLQEENFRIGVSVDGPEELNANRVGWSGRPTFPEVLRGVSLLRKRGIRFGAIAVVNPNNVACPKRLYEFFIAIGCDSLNINIEEREGANQHATDLPFDKVQAFWQQLFAIWIDNPVLKIREFDDALGWCDSLLHTPPTIAKSRDLWPTISYSGDVFVLSPELAGAPVEHRNKFVLGNVLRYPLHEILYTSANSWYVREFTEGRQECKRTCSYYSFCGGGHASNKFFELGMINGTETAHCRNSRQAVLDAVLAGVSKKGCIPQQNRNVCVKKSTLRN